MKPWESRKEEDFSLSSNGIDNKGIATAQMGFAMTLLLLRRYGGNDGKIQDRT